MSGTADFDPIARPYRTLEHLTLGRKLEQTRLHFLPRLHTAKTALVLGDGDGRFLAELLAVNPQLEATAIDGSAAMLELLRRRCEAYAPRLRTIRTDALDYMPPADSSYDLVVSHFFLDCFTDSQIDTLAAHLAPALRPGTLWLLSDFRIPSGGMHLPAQVFVRSLYFGFRILTGLRTTRLPDHTAILSAAGFRRIEQQMFLAGILTTELWQLPSQTEP